MITVTISINGVVLTARSAQHTGDEQNGKVVYKVDEGTLLLHDPKDGAVALVKQMLDTIQPGRLDRE